MVKKDSAAAAAAAPSSSFAGRLFGWFTGSKMPAPGYWVVLICALLAVAGLAHKQQLMNRQLQQLMADRALMEGMDRASPRGSKLAPI